jgi:hypothetical protein
VVILISGGTGTLYICSASNTWSVLVIGPLNNIAYGSNSIATTDLVTVDTNGYAADTGIAQSSVNTSGANVISDTQTQYTLPMWNLSNHLTNSMFSQNSGASVGTVTGNLSVTGTITSSASGAPLNATAVSSTTTPSSGVNLQPITGLGWVSTDTSTGQNYAPDKYVTSAPSGSCSSTFAAPLPAQIVVSTGALWTCQSGTWAQVTGGGGGGTVTGLSGLTSGNAYANVGGTWVPADAWGFPTAGKTATFTNSSAVITVTNSAALCTPVQFSTTSALPTNFAVNTTYYVSSTGLSGSQIEVSATCGGSVITAGSAGSGTQTAINTNNGLVVPPPLAVGIATSSSVIQLNGVYTTTGLTAGSIYCISTTSAGAITTTCPNGSSYSGSALQQFGQAISTTQLIFPLPKQGVIN